MSVSASIMRICFRSCVLLLALFGWRIGAAAARESGVGNVLGEGIGGWFLVR